MPRIETSRETHKIVDSPCCPICGQPANVYRRNEPADLWEGFCDRCGDVRITQSAAEEARKDGKQHLVSAWLRKHPSIELIDVGIVERALKDTPEYSVLEKLDLTLVEVERLTGIPGETSKFAYKEDYPLIYARSNDEALFYLRQLAELKFLQEPVQIPRLTAKGYQRLSEMQRAGRISAIAFVAMWFHPSTNDAYDHAIEPAITEAGYKALRIDRVHHTNRIDDEIIGKIKGSRFMVADFSGQRQGVYFEAGLMLGLGRTVIWMCKKEELKDVHFDTRQYPYIDYETLAEAKQRLYERIIAIEGEGPELKATEEQAGPSLRSP